MSERTPNNARSRREVMNFIAAIETPRRRDEAEQLCTLFERVSGFEPRLWRSGIIGFGRYHYVYDSGREGTYLATGFAARKAAISVYIMPGYADYSDILARLGPHRKGKSCLYLTSLPGVDLDVLEDLVKVGLADLARRWAVSAT